jgi:type II secretory pathway pseudopilin PulG
MLRTILIAIAAALVTAAAMHFIYTGRVRKAREDARTAQSSLDSVRMAGLLAGKDNQIADYRDSVLQLKTRIASDSIAHLSQLQAIRAINRYILSPR